MTLAIEPDDTSNAVTRLVRPSLLYVVKQLELAVRARLDDILKDAGITALQYTALTVLDHHDGLSPAQLARDSSVRPQSTADLVANLEHRNLVRRDRNPANRRELVVSLTPQGRKLLARYAEIVAALEKDMTSGLDPDDIETFRSYLDACRVALNRSGAWSECPQLTPPDIQLRFATLLGRLGPALDGPGTLADADAWYFILEGTREPSVAEAQAMAVTELAARAAAAAASWTSPRWAGGRLGSTAEDIATVITHAVMARRPRARYLINPVAKSVVTLHQLLPGRAYDAVLRRQYKLPT
jgi:DNA-binding MarR family transcriptional regulator